MMIEFQPIDSRPTSLGTAAAVRRPLSRDALGTGLALAVIAAVVVSLLLRWQSETLAAAELLTMLGLVYAPPFRTARSTRVILIGSSHSAAALAAELAPHRGRLQLVGRVASETPARPDRQWLGPLNDLRSLVEQHDVDLLLLSGGVPRMQVFDELERSCLSLRVRMCELAAFYEDHFGHVPIAEINSAWFQCVLHPRHNPLPPRSKRVFDVIVSVLLGLVFGPFLLLLAALIRRDGGPALYRQVRVGEQGRPFTMLKLRTMRVRPDGESSWATANDERVTPIGALLRRLHLDELPQIVNVLRGEMSIVGPRPEQPRYVEQLERSVPFYSRRHQLRPGLAGWAQLHCGYGGSEAGTTWKLSHDLYYLRHRSLSLDAKILVRTLAMVLTPHQFGELQHRPLVFGIPVEEPEPEFQIAVGH
jgi:exopolysaccharide biosynthesis polyprenyl glycosylphosphotransferase